ncbi:MAG: HupE/UreJ family protein [Armatimonadetes bacterium]|nr:HupE/UreJ family protein [Armatimonadota bacterium]
MRRLFLVLLLLMTMAPAWGHAMPSSDVILRLQRGGIGARLILPIIELRLGWQKPLPMDAVETIRQYGPELKGYVIQHVRPTAPDGRPWTVRIQSLTPIAAQAPNGFVASSPDVQVDLTMTPPPDAPTDRLTLHYDVIFHRLITHTAIVSLASDWRNGVVGGSPVLLGTMRDTQPSMVIDRSWGSWFRGFAALFRLGARHIAEGTDHLLFLLALLLPAPLVAAGRRWGGYAGARAALRRIVKIVTAFTVGHSVTLLLGALGCVHPPESLIESAIALSIFVSAVHALVPIFRGKEIFIAGGFGLVHGLAFAATLTEFGLDPLTMASSVLGFNLGIEAFQLLVILITMPWLILLARTRLYPPLRVAGACLTGVAALGWMAERALGWNNPVGVWVDRAAAHALVIVAGLALLSLLASLGGVAASGRHGPPAEAG